MTLHLVKLCVGVESVEQLQSYIEQRQILALAEGRSDAQVHTTRMVPTRREEILDGGSLYWVIKGNIQARQKIIDIHAYKDGAGKKCCDIIMEPHLVLTQMNPRRPFQGWRYLKGSEAPADISSAVITEDIPEAMRRELQNLCLV
ncbi:DUF1489 family protein [Flexibacterium corallicola]|uniref:DUF1489 family protein n=1 Tax=Flexibacterium corallicola TaxID=3037259 RepID=UPI00286F54C5|nr:DUF1489 domain-containing protein [Pseudovibrio sp. M1P-2-3]